MQPLLCHPTVRPAKLKDASCLAPNLRQADIEELSALRGIEPEAALTEGYYVSTACFSITIRKKTIAMFGVAPSTEQIGCVWMLGSDEILNHRFWFLRSFSHHWVNQLHQFYPTLFNYVDKRNTTHIRWLKWLGFSFTCLHPNFGVASLPFYEFWRYR